MVTNDKIYLGTELKLNINIEPIGGATMSSYDWDVEMYCTPSKSQKILKADAVEIDDNNYVVLVDTNAIGTGALRCKLTAAIVDADFSDFKRNEVVVIDTGIQIVKPF